MLDLFTTGQRDLQSPLTGTPAPSVTTSPESAYSAAREANDRLNGYGASLQNQSDFLQQRIDGFEAKTGTALPKLKFSGAPGASADQFDDERQEWLKTTRDAMTAESQRRNDPTLLPPTDEQIAAGGLEMARGAVRRQAALGAGPTSIATIGGRATAGAVSATLDPYNAISLAVAPEGGPLLISALRMGGAMAAQTLLADSARFGYRRQVDPEYGVGDVAADVLESGAAGALFGAGHGLGGQGIRGTLGAAAGGAIGGAAFGGMSGGGPGAIEGALGGAGLPLAGAGLGASTKALGMSWRALKARSPDLAVNMPLEVRDAGEVAEKAGDLHAQNPWTGPAGDAAHGEAIGAAEDALVNGKPFDLPQAAKAEAAARRGQVFYPGGSIDARYDLAEHADLVTSHDADFNVRPDYPSELQPRDRSGAPAQDQVNTIAANLEPDRLGPSPEANAGAPIVGPDGVVESGNGRVLAVGKAYDAGRGDAYRQWLEQQGYDTTVYDKPVLVGMRETPLNPDQRAGFAHAANGSASLRMSATEQALSDARLIDSNTLDLAKSPDLSAAANRDFARQLVAKLPQGERGGMLTRDGNLSANGARRMQGALAARAYGDPAFLSRALDHPDSNIKAIAGAMSDAAASWARMRDAATRGDIEPGHDITRDVLQAVHAIMRARDEGRPAWEMLNQGDIFQSDTTQLAARMFFRDEAMRQPAGRGRVAEALTSYADEAAKNTTAGRLFDDAVSPADVLRRATTAAVEKIGGLFETAAQDVLAMVRAYHGTSHEFDRFDSSKIGSGEGAQVYGHGLYFAESEGVARGYRDKLSGRVSDGAGHVYQVAIDREPEHFLDWDKRLDQQSGYVKAALDKVPSDLRDAVDSIMDERGQVPLFEWPDAYEGRHLVKTLSHHEVNEALPAELPGSSWYEGSTTESAHTAAYLRSLGIAGIRYFDSRSRNASEGTRNYVVFDDKDISITHRNGEPAQAAEREDVLAMARKAEGGEEPQRVSDGIRQLVDLASQPGHNHVRIPVGVTSDWLARTAAEHGLTIDGFEHTVDTSAIRHIMDRHGHSEEIARGGVRVTADDIAALPEVLASPDKVVFGATNPRGQPLVVFVKSMPDGSTLITEEVRARSAAVSSMRKYPATNDVLGNVALYVRNDGEAPLKVVDVPKGVNAIESDDVAPRTRPENQEASKSPKAGAAQEDLTLRNAKTGEAAQAQAVTSLKDALKAFDVSRDPNADILQRASVMAIGDRLAKIIGDMKVYTVGPEEMRTLAAGRMKILPGHEPAGFYDLKTGYIVALDDALRDPREASRLMIHEGAHGAFSRTIDESESARNVIDHLRQTATAAHLDRGGEAADHYGLRNAHEFVSEGFANPEFQRFLASIPADDRLVQAFGLDKAPGYSLWDVFVGAVRKILGFAPDQHTLLDATLRLGDLLEQRRAEIVRGDGDELAPMMRPIEADSARTPEEDAARARSFSDAKDAISYRINSDRIAQHPKGPLAGFLGILTRDIHEKGGINVESVQQDYEGRMAEATEKILEPYASKFAGLKQDVAGIRDVIREVFGVDTKNATAKTAAEAWRAGVDGFATEEAKRLGKVFTPAEDWRVPQFWESSRAQKFGKVTLLADMEREIQAGGLKVFDPDTHEEANPLRMRAILDGAADKIVTDASMGGTHGGAFKTDMRVFRFADGEAGSQAYLNLMDKYGAGRGGYLQMMQAHVGKVSRELGLARVLGPGWAEVGEKLLQDTLLADKKARANRPPRDLAQRLKDLPQDTGKLLTGWLESPAKAEAVWQHISGQASGVGSELMAGLLSGTRAFMTSTRMGSALVTAVPADTVNWLMAAKHNGLDMGRMVSEVAKAFVTDSPERREEAARLGIVAHAGSDAALGTKRFEDQFVGEALMKRMADFVIRAQGLHAWDAAIKRAFPMEFLGAIGQRAGKAFDDLDAPFAGFIDRYGLKDDWAELSRSEHALDVGDAKYLHPDRLPEPTRIKLMSAIYDERQFAYLAGGTERVRAITSQAKAGTFLGEMGRSVMLFKSFPMTMLATWGMRAAREAGQGRVATLATLITGMTMAGALAMQARSLLQGKDPRSMKDPFFWGESFLQGGAAGIYGDFFKEAFSRSDTSLTETMMGPLSAIPAGIQGLTSGARRAAESGEKVNFGAKLSRIISQNTPGGNLWYSRLLASRLVFDNVQRMIDRDHAKSFARQQQRALKTNHQGFFWAPGQNAPSRAPDLGAMLQ